MLYNNDYHPYYTPFQTHRIYQYNSLYLFLFFMQPDYEYLCKLKSGDVFARTQQILCSTGQHIGLAGTSNSIQYESTHLRQLGNPAALSNTFRANSPQCSRELIPFISLICTLSNNHQNCKIKGGVASQSLSYSSHLSCSSRCRQDIQHNTQKKSGFSNLWAYYFPSHVTLLPKKKKNRKTFRNMGR